MEEDGSVKAAPVTRLRRRLSVEPSEDGNSSPAPSTPTKKRGGRLAAKPQLELINENTPVSSPKRTRRKSFATEAEEKPITPSRRSARIKSNSSIVSETQSLQALDSPRAKRAARRNSQAGSDNEGPATPARQTRRTRKDSASSVENQETGTLNKAVPVAEMVIEEEPENEVQKTAKKAKASPTTASEELSPNSARKSKRLLDKRNRRSGSYKTDQDTSSNKSLNISTTNEKGSSETESISRSPLNKSVKSKEPKDNLSESNMSLMTKLDTETKLNKSNHNKSASDLNTEQNDKGKRNRTESWPTIKASEGNESINLSDNEVSRKKKKKSNKLDFINDSTKINKTDTSINEQNSSQSFLDTSSKRKKRKSETSLTNETEQKNEDLQTTEAPASKGSGISRKEISNVQSDNTNITSDVAMLFETAPDNVQATVYFEDSDSNSVSAITTDKNGHLDSEDQCVPVVKHDFKGSLSPENSTIVSNAELVLSNEINKDNTSYNTPREVQDAVNNSCEPMDFDETIHDEISQKSLDTLEQSKSERKSLSMTQETNKSKRKSSISDTSVLSKTTEEETNKSKRKSSISNADADTADLSKSTVEETNKSQRKLTISNPTADDLDQSKTAEEETNKSKSKLSISNAALSKTTVEETNKSKRKSSISRSAADALDQSKTTEEETNKSKRKSSTSNAADISDLTKTTVEESNKSKRKSSISKSAADALEQPKTTEEETNKSKRKSSTSNAADTSDRSKDDNKSTLILSQIKDVSSTSETINSPKPIHVHEVLSKSEVNVNSIVNKKVSKGNLSVNDVKGTPKHKNIHKLTMQTSTPIITEQPDIATKGSKQNNSTEKNKANFSKSVNDSDSSEEESDDDESSLPKSKLLNDEAEEASDDYESGDSRDEEERKYEADHEIIERGETLTTDDDISNDTDYEKDSFIVSSDPEDHELLSGSGDDLAISDNELTMSKKSKKKYNERKLKEQKNASREMFESRHKLNTSDQNSPTPKMKKNRMRIDSSLLASDEEEVVKPKKNNRMRLDSTLDTSVKEEETNISLNKSRKRDKTLQDDTLNTTDKQVTNVSLKKGNKNKSMQDSVCNKSAVDEKEMTIFNESTTDNADPLQVNFKQEPKTPQKDLNMSVVQFTDRQEIENVQMTESDSILNQTGTDPLQATMAGEDSDSSESEEIMQNYDAVLDELNKGKKTKLKNNNISLNMDQKSKKNRVEPIIDQLNLTHTKKPKKNKNRSEDVVDSKSVETSAKTPESDNESSYSIDLKLLFSEDSVSDGESQQNRADDDCIPLKKTPGKTNIRESIDMNTSLKDSTLNESSKKKKKRKSSITPVASNEDQELINADDNELNKSKTTKMKQNTSSGAKAAAETLYISSSYLNESGIKKKKKHSISEPAVEESQDILNKSKDVSMNENGRKKKKKLSISEPAVEETQDMWNKSKEINVSLNQSGLKKKKKLSISEPAVEESQGANNAEPVLNESIKKKKQRKSSLNAQDTEQPEGDLFFIDTKGTLEDNKDNYGEPNEPSQNVSFGSKKKKKKNKSNVLRNENEEKISDKSNEESNAARTPKSEKKKEKKISQKVETLVDDDSDGAPDEAPYLSVKATEADLQNTDMWNKSKEINVSLNQSGLKKKKKLSISEPAVEESQGANNAEPVLNESIKKKKQRKSSLNAQDTEQPEGDLFFIDTKGTLEDNKDNYDELNEPSQNVSFGSKKKKKKNKSNVLRNENEEKISDKTNEESNAARTPKSEKKKEKKISQKVETLVDGDSDGAPDEAPYLSVKATEADLQNTETVTESAEGSEKKKKKKKKSSAATTQSGQSIDTVVDIASNSKKRKRKSSNTESSQGDAQESVEPVTASEVAGSQKKKRKTSHNDDKNSSGTSEPTRAKKKNKKNLIFQETALELETVETHVKKNKKRKNRDENGDNKRAKVSKDSSFQEVYVPRLPDDILTQLDDKPRKMDTAKVVSTSTFIVETARQKRAKPSHYLEESIYLDADSPVAKKEKSRIKKPKVLPFIPTASISDRGFTTHFKINKLSQATEFEAEPFGFSKESYLQKKSIKRLGTYELYKKQILQKLSKF